MHSVFTLFLLDIAVYQSGVTCNFFYVPVSRFPARNQLGTIHQEIAREQWQVVETWRPTIKRHLYMTLASKTGTALPEWLTRL